MQSTGGDLDMAVSSYFDMMSGNTGAAPAPAPAPARSVEAKPAPSGPRSTPASSATQRATAQISDEEYARRLAAEMHQLDDDDDVVMMTGPSGASRPGVGSGKGWGAAGDVRAADDQRVDRLIDGNSAGIPLGALGVAGQMLGTFRMPQVHRAFLEGPASAGGKGGGRKGVGAAASGKLASLLSAPSELVFPGPYEAAREFGKAHKRWLLVNIQKDEEFDRFVGPARIGGRTWPWWPGGGSLFGAQPTMSAIHIRAYQTPSHLPKALICSPSPSSRPSPTTFTHIARPSPAAGV